MHREADCCSNCGRYCCCSMLFLLHFARMHSIAHSIQMQIRCIASSNTNVCTTATGVTFSFYSHTHSCAFAFLISTIRTSKLRCSPSSTHTHEVNSKQACRHLLSFSLLLLLNFFICLFCGRICRIC